MNRTLIILSLFLPLVFIQNACTPRDRYDSRVKRELARGERYDSLFMGIYMGMTDRDFYSRCWNLNKQGLVKQGLGNTTVQYITRDELKAKATMDFYPTFINGKIATMPVIYSYTGWAPWNKELSADMLMNDLLRLYRKVYGGGFMKVRNNMNGTLYVKIDGNRRITIFKKNELSVWAIFTDMSVAGDMPLVPADSSKQKSDTTVISQ